MEKHELHLFSCSVIMKWKEMCISVRLLYEQSIVEMGLTDVSLCMFFLWSVDLQRISLYRRTHHVAT